MSAQSAAVEAANAELYAAFEAGDLDRMAAVWADGEVVCVHPGWPMLRGRSRVLRSWAVIMANTPYIQFFLTDLRIDIVGAAAVVTCEEHILTELATDAGRLGDTQRAVATNVFRAEPGGWRLWLHHASPVIAPAGPAPDEAPDEAP